MAEAAAPVAKARTLTSIEARAAAIDTVPTASTNLTPDQQKLVDAVRQEAAENPGQALSMLSGRELPPKEVAIAIADQRIGPDRDLDTTTGLKDRSKAPAHETKNFADAQKRIKEAYKFVREGVITDYARAEVLRMLYEDPGARQILEAKFGTSLDVDYRTWQKAPNKMSTDAKDFLDGIINRPEYNAKFRARLTEVVDQNEIKPDESAPKEAELETAKEKLKLIEGDLDVAKADSVAKRLEDIQTSLNQYDRTLEVTGVPKGPQAQQLVEAGKAIAKAQSSVASLEAEVELLSAMKLAKTINAADEAKLNTLIPRLNKARSELAATVAKRDGLLAEETRLKTEKQTAEREVRQLKLDKADLEGKVRALERELLPLRLKRQLSERKFIESVNGMFADAAVDFMNDRMTAANSLAPEVAGKIQGEIEEQLADKLEEIFMTKYWRDQDVGRFWQRKTRVRVFDAAKIDTDYRAALATHDPEAYLTRTLMKVQVEDAIRDKYGVAVLTAPQQKEADELLKDFGKKHGRTIANRLMVFRFRTGQIRPEDAIRLQSSKLGIGFVEDNWTKSEALRTEVARIAGEGKGPIEFSKLPAKKFFMIILAIMAFLMLGTVVAGGAK